MESISRLSPQESPLYRQLLSAASADVTLTINPDQSNESKQVCTNCLQPISSPRSLLDHEAKTQAQRICDICKRALVQNEPCPNFFHNDYDDNFIRAVKYMKVGALIAGIFMSALIIKSQFGYDSLTS